MIAARVNGTRPAKPRLRLLTPARPTIYDSITRDSILARVRYLGRAYGLQWAIEQACFNVANVDCLEDNELGALLRDMERARECLNEGISFDEAGLMRSNADDIPEWT